MTRLLQHFSWLLHQSIGYQKAFQVSTQSKQMQTCKPWMIFNEDPCPISMLVVCTSWLSVPHGIQHLKERKLQTNPSRILLSVLNWWWMCFVPSWLLSAATLLRASNISPVTTSGWLLSLLWSCILRENAMHQSLLDSKLLCQNLTISLSFWCWNEQLQIIPISWLCDAYVPKYPFISAKISEYFVRE